MVYLVPKAENSPEVARLLATKSYSRATVKELAGLLPESDADLHSWLVAKAEEMNRDEFGMLCAAAEIGGRVLSPALLPQMFALQLDYWVVVRVAWRMEGEVVEQLLRGIEENRISGHLWSISLFVAAAWWMEHRKEEALPPRIVRSAVDLLSFDLDDMTLGALSALATHIGKEGKEIATAGKRHRNFKVPHPRGVRWIFKGIKRPFEQLLPEREERGVGGATQRRAADKAGRNENCRCGSGKKYKYCCEKMNLKRRFESSSVAGVTRSELEADPHIGLDAERVKAMSRTTLLTLDPARISDDLQIAYLLQLKDTKCCDRIVEAYEAWDGPAKRGNVWSHMFQPLISAWRPDLARRLVKHAPTAESHYLDAPDLRLLLVGDDPGAFLKELETAMKEVLESGSMEGLQELVWAVGSSPYQALSVVLMRGLLPLSDEETSQRTYDAILRTRARLGLGPDDAYSGWMNERALRRALDHETEAVREAQDKLAQNAAASRRSAEDIQRLERELKSLKKKTAAPDAAKVSTPIDEETKRKIRALTEDKKKAQALARERGEAEVAARKELEKRTRENEAPTADQSDEPGEEEEGYESYKVNERQYPRPIALPKDFGATLAKFDTHIARGAVRRLGRMGAAEADAFGFLKKVKAFKDVLVLEARVTKQYRLLVCLLPKCIRVVGLVYRKDLEKFIEHCLVAGLPPVMEFE